MDEERKKCLLDGLIQKKRNDKVENGNVKKKHKKKKRDPKNSTKEIDPERWIPKWQRKKYMKSKKNKGKTIHQTQGIVSTNESKGPSTANISATSSRKKGK